jgi:hypothetical protein
VAVNGEECGVNGWEVRGGRRGRRGATIEEGRWFLDYREMSGPKASYEATMTARAVVRCGGMRVLVSAAGYAIHTQWSPQRDDGLGGVWQGRGKREWQSSVHSWV